MSSSLSGGTTLSYDPLGRLWQTSSAVHGFTRFLYEGDRLAAEYHALDGIRRRHFWGQGVDQPIVQTEGAGVDCSTARFLHADHQGSIVASSDCAGNRIAVIGYDEYGVSNASSSPSAGRFRYTGQAWLPDIGMYYYKARIYSPLLGRFLQTDPIGYEDQMNLYAYVGNDPMNFVDPTGMCTGSLIANGDGTCRGSGMFTSGAGLCGGNCTVKDSKSSQSGAGTQNGNGGASERNGHWHSRPTTDDGEELTVTAAKWFPDSQKWILIGGRFYPNPYYNPPIDVTLGQVILAGPTIAAGVVAAPEAAAFAASQAPKVGSLLFSRGTGLLNTNNIVRIGWGWKGSASSGQRVFRLAIGHRSWQPIPGLTKFPWHFP